MEVPAPAAFVHPEFVYHFHEAPVPSDPPETLTVVELPALIFADPAVAPVGAIEGTLTVMVVVAVAVLPHVPSART